MHVGEMLNEIENSLHDAESANEKIVLENYCTRYQIGDIAGVLKSAAKLADIYLNRSDIKLLKLNSEVIELCGIHSDTTTLLISKSAIEVAMNTIESSTNALLPEETLKLIYDTLLKLPLFYEKPEFAISIAKRIARLYDVGTYWQLITLRGFIYGLDLSFSLLDGTTLQGVDCGAIVLISECRQILFSSKTPPPLTEDYKNLISLPDEKEVELENEHIRKLNEIDDLSREIQKMEESTNWICLPELERWHKSLVDYHTSYVPWRGKFVGDTEYFHLQSVISLLSLWRNYDFDYVFQCIQPYAERLLSLKGAVVASSIGNQVIAGAFMNLADIFGMAWDMRNAYTCCMNFLKYENFYYRKICFEYTLDIVNEKILFGYPYYHGMVFRMVDVADRYKFSTDELYVELCTRKNLAYLAEAWNQRYKSIADVEQFIAKEILLADVKNAIPEDTVFIDIICYYNEFKRKQCSNDETDNEYAHCIAFIMHPKMTEIRFLNLGLLSDAMANLESACFVENLLSGLPYAEHLIVCAEGDFNRVSFASLPYSDGYVIDRFTVRNIGSIYDVLFPRERPEIKNALVISSPDFERVPPSSAAIGELTRINNFKNLTQRDNDRIISAIRERICIDDKCIQHLMGADATIDAIRRGLEATHSIIHFSTHGRVIDDTLVLFAAGANFDCNAMLLESDLRCFSLDETRLVVYAICYGGRQLSAFDDSLSGFVKFSLLSGVSTVIAPLFPVLDSLCAILMEMFYEIFLSNANQLPETAFQQAVIKLRTSTRDEIKDKYQIIVSDTHGEFPFASPKYWGQWVCFSREEMR